MKIYPCKHCKRGRVKIQNTQKLGSKILADKCIYCLGKGYVIEDDNINKQEDIKKYNENEKGGNI